MTVHGIWATVVVCALLAAWVVRLVIRGRLWAGYGVIWLVVLAGAALLVAAPPATALLTRLAGAQYPASALTMVALVFVVIVLIYYSSQLSIIAQRVNRVAQELGTLQMDLREANAAADPDDTARDA